MTNPPDIIDIVKELQNQGEHLENDDGAMWAKVPEHMQFNADWFKAFPSIAQALLIAVRDLEYIRTYDPAVPIPMSDKDHLKQVAGEALALDGLYHSLG